MPRIIDLTTGPVGADQPQRWYYGCGSARLALRDGVPIGLVYESPHYGAPTALPADADEILIGMASCWEFVSA